MSVEPFEYEYFNWLCAKVLEPGSDDYAVLMEILYKTDYIWTVARDDNRAEDALYAKRIFLNELGAPQDIALRHKPCSILEMLVSFCERAEFHSDRMSVQDWFMQFLTNLNLEQFKEVSEADVPVIEDILHTFVWRLYEADGSGGGLFPQDHPRKDQREVELWFQFHEYIISRGL